MENALNRFITALEASNVITGIIALMIVSVDVILFARGESELPGQLWLLTGIVFGVFFGGRAQTAQATIARAMQAAIMANPPSENSSEQKPQVSSLFKGGK